MKRKNILISSGIITIALAFFLFVPLPFNVKCAVEIKPSDAERVIVKSAGRLESVKVSLGDRVRQYDPIAQLRNIPLEVAIQEAVRQKESYQTQLASLQRRKRYDRPAVGEIPIVQRALESTEENLVSLRQQQDWLQVTAPIDGVILPTEEKKPDPTVEGRLPTWDGSLMRPENLGARVELDQVICLIGVPNQFEALLVIDQADLPFVSKGCFVRLRLDAYTNVTLTGEIAEIASADMEVSPATFSNQVGGKLATVTDATGVQRPQSASYEARVPLTDPSQKLYAGLRGRAKIEGAEWQTLGARFWRMLTRTFHFRI